MTPRRIYGCLFVALVGTVACANESISDLGIDDDPTGGGKTGSGDAAAADGASSVLNDAGPAKPSGNNCGVGYRYCGGNKITGETDTLYECKGPGEPGVVEKCAMGCQINPVDIDDSCKGSRADSPVPGYVVTYAWGEKDSVYRLGYHTGDDYASPMGTPVVAVLNGTIGWSNDDGGDFGHWIALDASNGRTYVYCHLSERDVQVGDKVTVGQVLGKVGTTGFSTGPHLHFEDRPLGATTNDNTRKPTW